MSLGLQLSIRLQQVKRTSRLRCCDSISSSSAFFASLVNVFTATTAAPPSASVPSSVPGLVRPHAVLVLSPWPGPAMLSYDGAINPSSVGNASTSTAGIGAMLPTIRKSLPSASGDADRSSSYPYHVKSTAVTERPLTESCLGSRGGRNSREPPLARSLTYVAVINAGNHRMLEGALRALRGARTTVPITTAFVPSWQSPSPRPLRVMLCGVHDDNEQDTTDNIHKVVCGRESE